MKHLSIFLIRVYQLFLSPLLLQVLGTKAICRYQISCSDYAKHEIAQKGFMIGSTRAVRRLLSCQPFAQ